MSGSPGSQQLISTPQGLSSAQSLSRVRLFATPWTAARQASLSITHSRSLLRPMSIESVMPSNYLILCRPLLLLACLGPIFVPFCTGPSWVWALGHSWTQDNCVSMDSCAGWALHEHLPAKTSARQPQQTAQVAYRQFSLSGRWQSSLGFNKPDS